MKIKKNGEIPLDKFIDLSLYNKKIGYYMKKNPFGKKGDFITAPNISRLFSEMIAIWIISFWKNLGSPRNFNLIELGAGDGEMMKVLLESFQNFPSFLESCNIIIHEKSPILIRIQKEKLSKSKIIWVSQINKIKKNPSIFIANEFFDAMPIKQFKKLKNIWYEKFVNFENYSKASFIEKKIDIKKIERRLNFKISQNQSFIEYSEFGFDYLKNISDIMKKNTGGLLIIDYGYLEKKMKNTLQAVSNHKFANILDNIGGVDITHNINFELFKKFTQKLGGLDNNLNTQRNFLIKMGIKQRAELLSRNKNFSKKADIFYRLNRLIDEKQMGTLFKVMFIKSKKIKITLCF